MSDNNAKTIEKLVKLTVAEEQRKVYQDKFYAKTLVPLVSKKAVPEEVVKAKDKIQSSKTTTPPTEGGGIKSPLTQFGAFEVYEPALHTDSTGILTFVYMPLQTATFRTADVIPKEVKFIFNDVPRAP